MKLSCSLFGDFPLTDSETPVSDAERRKLWLASLERQGYVLIRDTREIELLDCDKNRELLVKLIEESMPSARVLSFGNFVTRGEGFRLRDLEINIQRIEDILKLPTSL